MPCLHRQRLLVSCRDCGSSQNALARSIQSEPDCFHLLATDVSLDNLLVVIDGVSCQIPVDDETY